MIFMRAVQVTQDLPQTLIDMIVIPAKSVTHCTFLYALNLRRQVNFKHNGMHIDPRSYKDKNFIQILRLP